jgi:fatty-acyl-CoA synthase
VSGSVAVDVGSLIANRAISTPSRKAITFAGETLTFADLGTRVGRLAHALHEGGMQPGDRIAYIGSNHPSFLETFFAAATLGAIFVPLNARLTASELSYIISDAGVHTIVSDADRSAVIDAIRDECKISRCVSLAGQRDDGTGDWNDYEALMTQPQTLTATHPDPDDVALIMYTSGTTGRPKGAMLTHANLFWHHVNAMHSFDVSADDVTLVVAPLFHIGGLDITTLGTLIKGGHAVVAAGFDAGEAIEMIQQYRVTTMFGVPAMFNLIAQHAAFEDANLSSVKYLVCGGAPVPELLLRIYGAREVPFVQAYGLTETAPLALVLERDEVRARPGSAGHRLMLLSEVRIVDPDNQSLPQCEPGEVCVRRTQVMAGYWNNPSATSAVIDHEGWFHSGDVGYMDEDGFVYIVDRSKDMVISGGENVYPAEVEAVLYDHPSVAEVAIIGTAHERWGEAVTAIVVTKSGHDLTLEQLREFARSRLAGFKLPIRMELVPELPRTQSGKVLKYQLREDFGARV